MTVCSRPEDGLRCWQGVKPTLKLHKNSNEDTCQALDAGAIFTQLSHPIHSWIHSCCLIQRQSCLQAKANICRPLWSKCLIILNRLRELKVMWLPICRDLWGLSANVDHWKTVKISSASLYSSHFCFPLTHQLDIRCHGNAGRMTRKTDNLQGQLAKEIFVYENLVE